MKKTLAMILVLGSVACATDAVYQGSIVVLKDGTPTSNGRYSDYAILSKDGTSAVSGTDNWMPGNKVTFDVANQTITTNGGNFQFMNQGSTDADMYSFSIRFDADWTKAATGLSTLVSVGEAGGAYAYNVVLTEDNQWTINTVGYGTPLTLTTQTTEAQNTGSGTYLLTTETKDNQYYVSVYCDEKLIVAGNSAANHFGQSENIMIGFGAPHYDSTADVMNATYKNIELYKGVAPEPATATLSLLALAGLASRRRRH